MGPFRTASASFAVALLCATAAGAQLPPPDPPPSVPPWHEAIDLYAFADAYASVNYDFPKPQPDSNRLRAYDASNGVALSWVGFDARYEPDPVGGGIELRFGPTAEAYARADAGSGLEFVKQAYASWRPGGADGALRLDFGKLDAIYGFEKPESQDNPNYTRGVLDTLVQPNFYAGLHAEWQATPALALHALVVNGADRTLDNNIGKTFGLGLRLQPTSALELALGWLGGPEQDDTTTVTCPADTAYDPAFAGCGPSPGAAPATQTVDRGGANDVEAWRHLIDLLVVFDATETLRLYFNADYGFEGVRGLETPEQTSTDEKRWYGALLALHLQLDEVWGTAVRGEYLADADGHLTAERLSPAPSELSLVTATLTVEAAPTEHLLLRLDLRGDFALQAEPSRNVFAEGVRGTSRDQLTTTLGVVVKTQ